MSPRSLALLTLLLTITFAVSPFLSPEFGGFDPDRFPIPQNDPPVQPAGYAFAIWGVIYLWLVIGMGWGLWRRGTDPQWTEMRKPLILSLAVGTIWLPVALASPIWASVLIWIMLISALVALFRSPEDDVWFASLPLGLYAGWLSAASCVSLGLLAAGYGFTSEGTAALIFIFLAIVIASAVQTNLGRAPTYGVAVIWALLAIVVQNAGTNPTVAAIAIGGGLALLVPVVKTLRA